MARAYELLIGLTEVDQDSPFYRHHFPGFDGRRGCEGCATDVKKMRELTHYLGYEPVTLEPLLNERATRARVLSLLSNLATPEYGMKQEDIFLLYLTCHGRTLGGGPNHTADKIFDGSAVNMFLLHDAPIFGQELWEPLLQWAARGLGSPRVFTIVDACHAGLGVDLLPAYVERLVDQLSALILRLIRIRGISHASLDALHFELKDLAKSGAEKQQRKLSEINCKLLHYLENQGLRLTHFGAARDELTAFGGPQGSLFTRRLRQFYLNGGYGMNYHQFMAGLQELVPLAHAPKMATIPMQIPLDCCPTNHFSRCETVFQIFPTP